MGYNSSIFLLMPKLDSNARAFIAAHESATGVAMGSIQKQAINNLFLRLKGKIANPNGSVLYPLISSNSKIWIHAPSTDAVASLAGFNIELFSATSLGTFNNFVSGDVLPTGLTGNTTTKYFDAGVTMAAFPQNSVSIGTYLRGDATAGYEAFGVSDGTSFTTLLVRAPTANKYGVAVNRNLAASNFSSANSLGLAMIERNNSTNLNIYKAGIKIGFAPSIASVAPLGTRNVYFHARNNNGTAIAFSPIELSGYKLLGTSLTSNQHFDFGWIIQNYNTEIITGGRQV